jgi:hypothetical protein
MLDCFMGPLYGGSAASVASALEKRRFRAVLGQNVTARPFAAQQKIRALNVPDKLRGKAHTDGVGEFQAIYLIVH